MFGADNFLTAIVFQKTSSEEGEGLANMADYLLWFAKDNQRVKAFPLYRVKRPGEPGAKQYVHRCNDDFSQLKKLSSQELADPSLIPEGWHVCRRGFPLTSQDHSDTRSVAIRSFRVSRTHPVQIGTGLYSPETGLRSLVAKGRIYSTGKSLNAIMRLDDMPMTELGNVWHDTGTGSFTDEQLYVVQTSEKVVERCIQLASEPGDLVLDPTCGTGTTAYAAEKWGRRWITIDTSQGPPGASTTAATIGDIPLLTSCWIRDRGPAGGFEYRARSESKNKQSDGGALCNTSRCESIANDEPPAEVVLVDAPEIEYKITRVSGPFVVEATIPTPVDSEADGRRPVARRRGVHRPDARGAASAIRCSKSAARGRSSLDNVRPPAQALTLSAEAALDARRLPVAIVFGPENGAVSEKLVYEAAREAHMKDFEQLLVIGFAIEPNARDLVEKIESQVGIPATYVQATPDLVMGDLLKTMRSSQLFSVSGLPDVAIRKVGPEEKGGPQRYEVELRRPRHLRSRPRSRRRTARQ